MKNDMSKALTWIAGEIMNRAQALSETDMAGPQAQREAGRIAGLSQALGYALEAGVDYEALHEMSTYAIRTRSAIADEATTARGCRYNEAAAAALNELSTHLHGYDFAAPSPEPEPEPESEPENEEEGKADEAEEAKPEDGGANAVRIQKPRRKHQRLAPQVKADDVLVWLLSRGEDGGVEIPVDDIAIQFYLKGGRDDTSAHKAALNIAYILEKRGLAELHSGHDKRNHVVVKSVSLTTHGVFEAQRIRGPLVSEETKSDDELRAEYAHLAEEVRDA